MAQPDINGISPHTKWVPGSQFPINSSLFPGIRTIPRNVSLLSTLITGFISRRLGAIRRNMTDFATVEATAVRRTRAGVPRRAAPFDPRLGAIARNMPRATAVVTRLGASIIITAASRTTPIVTGASARSGFFTHILQLLPVLQGHLSCSLSCEKQNIANVVVSIHVLSKNTETE